MERLLEEIKMVLPSFTKQDLDQLLKDPCKAKDRKQLIEIMTTFTGKRDGNLTSFKDGVPKYFLINERNSCAPDSILFILFFTKGSYFMDRIFNSKLKPKWPEEKAFADKMLPLLKRLYGNMSLWRKSITNIQRVIGEFTRVNCNDVKSGTQIWNWFSIAFPGLQFPFLTRMDKQNGNVAVPVTYLDTEMYTLDDLIEKGDFVIFGDDYRPRVRHLPHTIDKLQACLFFVGMAHYTAAVRGSNDKWYYYDDLRPSVLRILDPEKFIFDESPYRKIQLLFYFDYSN